jgi:hypothetical protein
MKIFQVAEYISSAFDIILDDSQKQNIFRILELLYTNNNINEEILLNLMKAFLVIFYNNASHCCIYIELFDNLSKEETIKLFNLIKKIKFSHQIHIGESLINKIILTINSYIINNINSNYNSSNFNMLLNIFNIYDIIKLNKKISFQNKIQLYIILLKNNANILDVRQSIALINKL